MGNLLFQNRSGYIPTSKELTFNPSRIIGIGKELCLDPFPREVRDLLEKRVVRDVVNIIAEYARYSTMNYSGSMNHWGMVRAAEYTHTRAGQYTLTKATLDKFLFFLRLAGTHVFLDRPSYIIFEQLVHRRDKWEYSVTDSLTLEILGLGQQICHYLASHRPIGPIEKFFAYFWSPYVEETRFEQTLKQLQIGYLFQLDRLALPGDDSLRGIISVFNIHDQEKSTYCQKITSAYFHGPIGRCLYTREEFLSYFCQLVEFEGGEMFG